MRAVLFLGASPVCADTGCPSSSRQRSIAACGNRELVTGRENSHSRSQHAKENNSARLQVTSIDKNKQRKDAFNSLVGYGEDRRVFTHGGAALCCAANTGLGRVWIAVEMNSGRDCVGNTCF